jgi:hypothetical protein
MIATGLIIQLVLMTQWMLLTSTSTSVRVVVVGKWILTCAGRSGCGRGCRCRCGASAASGSVHLRTEYYCCNDDDEMYVACWCRFFEMHYLLSVVGREILTIASVLLWC